jgi:2-oxo-4-hydroxy-4-carboxy-5-ureidoimidazoline decarboxylase
MSIVRITLDQLNALPAGAFINTLSGIFEHSPWVPEAALGKRPFTSVDQLHDVMTTIVDQAGNTRQLALINAHPELAGKAAVRGELTDESTREQSGAGLNLCTQEEFNRLQALNAAYREKFGFPFILAVRRFDRHGIIANFEARLHHGRDIELRESLQQIYRIARFRLDDLLGV